MIPYPVKLGHGLMDLIERIPADLLPSSGGVAAVVNIYHFTYPGPFSWRG